jgi:hypothetical protein
MGFRKTEAKRKIQGYPISRGLKAKLKELVSERWGEL